MDEYTVEVFANRDEPVPLLAIPPDEDQPSTSDQEVSNDGKRQRIRKKLSATHMKEKLQQHGDSHLEKSQGSPSLQDRLFNRLLAQVIPDEDIDSDSEKPVDRRSSKYVQRPAFSLPLMTNNFRRFNARIGIAFVFQNRLIRLFGWKTPTHTLSFLSVYTFICINPILLAIVPIATVLLFIMVPAFLARHPPPPASVSTSSTTPYSYYGPALAPAKTIRPASETSKDFFRNMRDLQNSMADFSNLHDMSVKAIAPLTNFSNQILSSTVFLFLTALTAVLFIVAHLLPWRLIFLVSGYTLICAGHPSVQAYLLKAQQKYQQQSKVKTNPDAGWIRVGPLPMPTSFSAFSNLLYDISSITLSSNPETREVEVFELQYRPIQPLAMSQIHQDEWEAHVFTPTPYDPLSPSRISGDRPRGCRFFEDVQPPNGWSWKGKKWELDLEAREWVAERLVTGVEFEVAPEDEGMSEHFGGWVWDLPPRNKEDDNGDDSGLALSPRLDQKRSRSRKEKEREQAKAKMAQRDWEEARGQGRTGEWRRRRWVRTVQRIGAGDEYAGRSSSSAEGK